MYKRFLSFILVMCITCFYTVTHLSSITAYAFKKCTLPTHTCVYLIQHVGSGKYLDVTDVSTQNGARLQIWERFSGNQNQFFRFEKVGNYWKIVPLHSKKCIEVRNSSKSNYAHVSQWKYDGLACQQWKVISNSDGTVSFQNRNSGKFLDVYGNGKANGTKIVQYSRNNTTAQRFRLYGCTANDILSASWERDFSKSPIQWSSLNTRYYVNQTTYFQNRPGYSASEFSGWFPKNSIYTKQNTRILIRVDYIDSTTVWNMIRKKSLYPSFRSSITDLLKGEATEETASLLLGQIGINVPVIGIPIGVLQIISESSQRSNWNKFANTAVQGKGMIVYTYATIEYTENGSGTKTYITDKIEHTYSVWDGKTVKTSYGYEGTLTYAFK